MTIDAKSWDEITSFPAMLGATLVAVDGARGDDTMTFTAADGRRFVFFHETGCCEDCAVEDVCGDTDDLLHSPIVEAEEVSSAAPPDCDAESFTWTFYRFATARGTVTVRWLGTSNGYYSESVSYRVDLPPAPPPT